MTSDMRKLIKALEAQGFTVTRTTKGHYNVHLGRKWVTTLSGTPSETRGWRNALAAMRRAGFTWPPKR